MIKRLAKKLRVRNAIFLNCLPPDKYYNTMYKAKAVVTPSIWPEPFGRIPVEANRLGVPAVVTDRGALPEIIQNRVTGVIAEAYSDSLAEAISKVITRNWSIDQIMKSVLKKLNPPRHNTKIIEFLSKGYSTNVEVREYD